ncbi:MAG: mechanosensitive ion channel family protein, partial [Myxococcota bacterium]
DSLDIHALLNRVYQSLTVALATWLGVRAVTNFTELWGYRAAGTEGTYDDQLVPIVRKAGKVFITVTGAVMVLQNLNYNVGSLLAGLGIGGAALAFASKDTVANFFGSLVIFIDRPFQIGDWVEIGDVEGTVEQVDIRVTRIRTFSNSLIIVPNSHMTVTAIQNWSRMRKRRIKLTIGVTYDATPDKMRAAVAAIRAIIEGDDRYEKDFYLVNFNELGESALEIFCYFFTSTTNWAEYMQIREEFLLAVMDKFQELELSFAFPTRTVHLQSDIPPGAPPSMLRSRPR